MLIFRDRLTGYEMCSDSFKMSLDDPVVGLMKVAAKFKSEGGGQQNYDIGANASAEDAPETLDEENVKSGVDVCLYHELKETPFQDVKEFRNHFKMLVKNLAKHYNDDESLKDQLQTLKTHATNVLKWVTANYDEIQFFVGDGCECECMCAFSICREHPCVEMYYFKMSLMEEKC